MKYILTALVGLLVMSCKDDTKANKTEPSNQEVKTKQAQEKSATESVASIPFLKAVKSLEVDTSNNPIEAFKTDATNQAGNVITLNKDNIKDALNEAKRFKYAVITVANHTIVKLMDLNDCKLSGAWGVCMPKAEGYIKKGDLIYQNDYANNIIGLPDNQERLLFLFN